jgi:hypothetical protein
MGALDLDYHISLHFAQFEEKYVSSRLKTTNPTEIYSLKQQLHYFCSLKQQLHVKSSTTSGWPGGSQMVSGDSF